MSVYEIRPLRFHYAIIKQQEEGKDYPMTMQERIDPSEKKLERKLRKGQVIVNLHERKGWTSVWIGKPCSHGTRLYMDINPPLDMFMRHDHGKNKI